MTLTHPKLIHIAIADDHTLLWQSLCNLINSFSGFTVDFEVSNGRELINGLGRAINLPDNCVIDINMPEKTAMKHSKK